MNIKPLALAALIAASSFSVSNAASILDPLKLTAEPSSSFSTEIDTWDGFWGVFLGVFNSNGYTNVFNAFASFAQGFDEENTEVTFNAQSLVPLPWQGYLTFNTDLQSVTFASSTNLVDNAVVAVPGPEAGAGMGALILGGMAFWLARRRKEQTALAV
jgi:hypothetical protein